MRVISSFQTSNRERPTDLIMTLPIHPDRSRLAASLVALLACWVMMPSSAVLAQDRPSSALVPAASLAAGTATPQVSGPAGVRAGSDAVSLNFVNADIQAVIRAVSDITGRNILIDPRVSGTVNLIAPQAVPKAMVLDVLLAALRAQGFTAAGGEGDMLRIIPEAEAKFRGDSARAAEGRGDQIVTEIFKLEFEQAQQVVTTLRPLVTPNNVINAFPATNTLVITDYADNIARIRRLIASIDQPNPGELITLRLRHASVLDVVQTLSRLMPEVRTNASGNTAFGAPTQPGAPPGATGGNPNERVLVSAEPRANALFIRSFNPPLVARIRELVEAIDVPTGSLGNLHVVYLRNAEATRMAEALRTLLTGQPSGRTGTASTSTPFGQGGFGSPGGQPPTATGGLGTPGGGLAQAGATQAPGLSGGPSASFGQTQNAAQPSGFSAGGATVQAYPDLNSLVIIAPDYLYNQLRSVIEQLDARRAQIYIEALIVEVTSDKAAEFGIQWQHLTGGGTSGTQLLGGTNFTVGSGASILGVAQNPTSVGPGFSLGVMNGTVSINGASLLNLGMLARALEGDTNTNILSTPSLLALDNEEAKIVVGQNIPIVTGTYTTAASGSTNPFSTVDRRDVGLQLRVRPQVTQGGAVKLQLYEEVSTIVAATVNTAQGIITNKRSIESTVLVDDGKIIVIGGLIEDSVSNNLQAVPLLGSIPIIGNLFRYDARERKKTNLMIFLRPVVLRDGEASSAISNERYDFIRGVQQGQQPGRNMLLPDMPPPQPQSGFGTRPSSMTAP